VTDKAGAVRNELQCGARLESTGSIAFVGPVPNQILCMLGMYK